jgi:hypothetical protein
LQHQWPQSSATENPSLISLSSLMPIPSITHSLSLSIHFPQISLSLSPSLPVTLFPFSFFSPSDFRWRHHPLPLLSSSHFRKPLFSFSFSPLKETGVAAKPPFFRSMASQLPLFPLNRSRRQSARLHPQAPSWRLSIISFYSSVRSPSLSCQPPAP